MSRPFRIAITSGDADGIGPEVVSKALSKLGPQKNVQFILFRSAQFPSRDLKLIKKRFHMVTSPSWSGALASWPESFKTLIDVCSASSPAHWVEEAARAAFFKHIDALVTGPLSKPTVIAAGMKDLGHTDILKRVAGVESAYMTFIGSNFSVFLATGHLPLSEVSKQLTLDKLRSALLAAASFAKNLLPKGKSRPIAVLGLNPHAGDQGLIGKEELQWGPLLESLSQESDLDFVGPLVPDAAFLKENWGKYLCYIALYHDQGLIPFKAIHGTKGTHITWGLPFIRTSVDHGTAKDIAGKNKADPSSMTLALKWAIELCERRRSHG